MANGIPSLTIVAQESLPVLQKMVPLISAFTTDYSAEVGQQGTAVAARIPSGMFATNYVNTVGYAPTDVGVTNVTVTLNPPTFMAVGFTDAEVGGLTLPRLMNTFIDPAVKAVINAVASGAFALVTSGNYGAASYIGTTYGFQNCIQTPIQTLDAAGVTSDKAVILNSASYWGTLNDVKQNYVIGTPELIREGIIGNLGGAKVMQAAGLPTNGQNLFGFAAGKESLAIATRLPFIAPGAPIIDVQTVTEPQSQLSLQLRSWYSVDKGQYIFMAALAYGVAVANTNAISRMTTA